MREPQARRDQREVVVPARSREPRGPARRRPNSGKGNRFATLGASAGAAGRAFLRHPGEIVGVAVVLGAVSLICLNALGHQPGRHPAPIFPKLPAQAAGKVAERSKAAPVTDGARAEALRSDGAKSDVAKSDGAKAEGVRPETVKAEVRPARDGIGDLIKADDAKSPGTTASVAPGGLSLAQVQRALTKLGYGPLKADGVMGPGTRAALEKFERDRNLPVKGAPTPRTLRELAARAGLPQG